MLEDVFSPSELAAFHAVREALLEDPEALALSANGEE